PSICIFVDSILLLSSWILLSPFFCSSIRVFLNSISVFRLESIEFRFCVVALSLFLAAVVVVVAVLPLPLLCCSRPTSLMVCWRTKDIFFRIQKRLFEAVWRYFIDHYELSYIFI